MTTISNIEELKDFIRNNELTNKQIETLVSSTLKVWFMEDYTKEEIIKKIDYIFETYPCIYDRPLFF